MATMDTTTLSVLGIIAVLAVLALVAWAIQRRNRSHRLHAHFGTEYDRTVERMGFRQEAEAELRERERRVERLHITPLAPADAGRHAQEWKTVQSHFVDNPRGALTEADALVRRVMTQRGYPVGDFESRAADISVDHPRVVENYRTAHAIAARDERGAANTEDLRKAVVHYRALSDDLLGVAPQC